MSCRPLYAAAVAATAVSLAGCIHLADQQSARLLEPGETEITPSFSSVSVSHEGDSEHVADGYGVRLGYGAGEAVELRATYERITVSNGGDDLDLWGLGAKFSLAEDVLALYAPIGFLTGSGVATAETWTIAPTLLATWRASQSFEVSPSVKGIYPFAAEFPELLLGFHLGAAFSTDLDRWAIRPEFGATINPGDEGTGWGWTLGFSVRP
ncbi:MAG: hypothetical protein GWM90_28805 [Gemmatimonadetes bacterium]|nr:hypothetical protein [Gemmatimonadota bacterium]NIQ59037.1 hypothetical protein [Gemmatimonadota bacterium]NIU79245.1 hypothetical protein [Gammaproteobacteria bacterium]NIX47926.1 hypothetical protein [Gemmatimonadota bacterium]NIY12291.1 hypothetical protein [Gemmatimonadota bacterium]